MSEKLESETPVAAVTTCSASSLPRWRFHKIRNRNGWIGIVDTHHKDAGHIAGWVRPEDAELTLAALNHFRTNAATHAPGANEKPLK